MQAEIDSARAEAKKAVEAAGEQARKIVELEAAAKAASSKNLKPWTGETELEKAVRSYLAQEERKDYQRKINRAWREANLNLGKLMDACWFGMSRAQRANVPECATAAQPRERGYWRRK